MITGSPSTPSLELAVAGHVMSVVFSLSEFNRGEKKKVERSSAKAPRDSLLRKALPSDQAVDVSFDRELISMSDAASLVTAPGAVACSAGGSWFNSSQMDAEASRRHHSPLWPPGLRDVLPPCFLTRASGHAGQRGRSLTPTTNSTASFTPGTSSESTGVGSL